METTKVGIREFRSDLAEYIASSTPVAVTRHGQTVGYFIPTKVQVEADIAALKKASETLDKLLEAQGVGTRRDRRFLRTAQLGGGDHLHRLGDLLRRLHRADADLEGFQ